MTIKIHVRTDKAAGSLEITEASEASQHKVLRGFFNLMGQHEDIQIPEIEIKGSAPGKLEQHETILPLEDLPVKPEKSFLSGVVRDVFQKPEIMKPEFINSARTLSSTIGERLGTIQEEEQGKPEWYKTGIKYKEGVPHYRLRYWCKNSSCKDKSNDYIKEDQTTVSCRKCGQKLKVRKANGDHLERDEWGNFFIADQMDV
ncbi:Phage protein [Paenibacillus algicola]|uniref:Phage protein n=2 Tax=Paenibacillus algicola TaxID=2565926 RepID=A0A4P8XMU8_9BACL|nr:Phage protein [Paenibacillus algicola]